MKITWKTCLKIGVTLFLLYIAIVCWDNIAGVLSAILAAAFPLLIGGAIAYVINIPMTFYEKHYFPKQKGKFFAVTRRPVCMTAAFLTVVAVVVLVVWLIIPKLGECVSVIVAKFPALFEKALLFAKSLDVMPEDIINSLSEIDWQSKLTDIIGTITSGVGNVVGGVISVVAGVFSGLVTVVLSIIFSIYILAAKDSLKSGGIKILNRYASEKWNKRIKYVLSVLDECFHSYIVGQCTEALVLGVLCTLGMLVFGFPYALMIGALVAFTSLIPVAGAYIGAGVGAFMILTESPVQALLFLLFILVLQQLEGNIIYPKVVGTSIGLPGIWVLAAVTIGGGIFGILGMLLGVPIAAAVYRIVGDDVKKAEIASETETLPTEEAEEKPSEEKSEENPEEENKE
ncbi:MAG: AI-2E family transporter [Oscillospiraceae bacterium]|nr:AI-2E family transporter [Oscillospiraceae bacterium]